MFSRNFTFQQAYIYITVIGYSVSQVLLGALENTKHVLDALTDAIPKASGFFVTMIITKTFLSLLWELARPWPLLSKSIARVVAPRSKLGQRQIFNQRKPDICRYAWLFPHFLLVTSINFAYMIITPLVCPFALVYFCLACVARAHLCPSPPRILGI